MIRTIIPFIILSFANATSLFAQRSLEQFQNRDDISTGESLFGPTRRNLRHNRDLQQDDLADALPVVEVIAQTFVLQLLEAYVGFADVTPEVSVEGPLSMFMPWDEAWRNLDPPLIAKLQSKSWGAHLVDLLHFHIYLGGSTLEDLVQAQTITMLNGEDVVVTVQTTPNRDRVKTNDVFVISDYMANNGAAYLLQEVMLPAWHDRNLLDLVTSTLPTLASFVVKAGLETNLQNTEGSLTIFAPSEEAFENLGPAAITYLDSEANQSVLRDILLYHIADDGPYPSVRFESRTLPTLLQGEQLQLIPSNTPATIAGKVNEASIILPDQLAHNG